jgi:hypothetical protein
MNKPITFSAAKAAVLESSRPGRARDFSWLPGVGQELRMKIPPSKFQSRNHARPLRSSFWRLCAPALNHLNVRAVGRVCSARMGTNTPLTRSQNYPLDWERLATPTLPNQAGNPAFTFISIRTFLRRWANRRAGVFCASGTEIILGEIAELPAGLGTPRYFQHSQTRRVIRRLPS